jgi:PAS domain S-box-containing protein
MNENAATIGPVLTPQSTLDIDDLPLPYAEIDAHGIVTRANRAARVLHHPEQGELIGKSGWDLMAIREKDSRSAAFLSQMASGDDPPVITRSLFNRSGSFRTYEMHRSMLRDAQGQPSGMRVIFVDVTDSKNALEEAARTAHWLRSAMQSVSDAVILTDTLGVIYSVNPAAEALSGLTANELSGRIIEDAFPLRAYEFIDGPPLDHRSAIESRCRGIATLLVRGSKQVKVEISTSPVIDEGNGSVAGVALLMRKLDVEA